MGKRQYWGCQLKFSFKCGTKAHWQPMESAARGMAAPAEVGPCLLLICLHSASRVPRRGYGYILSKMGSNNSIKDYVGF